MVLHADQIELSKRIGANIRSAGPTGNNFLADSDVATNTTVAQNQATIANASCHADAEPAKPRVNKAIDYGVADGTLTDVGVDAQTTVEGVVGLTQNDDHTREILSV